MTSRKPSWILRPRVLMVAAVLALGLGVVAGKRGCSGDSAPAAARGGPARMAFPVEVAPVAARNVEYTVTAVGSVEAFERVQVTARVAGVVERVRFREGEQVEAGQVLVEIEPERYRLAVDVGARPRLEQAAASAGRRRSRARPPRGRRRQEPGPDPRRGARDLPHPRARLAQARAAARRARRSPGASSTCATPRARADRRRHPDAHRADRPVRAAGHGAGDAAAARSAAAALPGAGGRRAARCKPGMPVALHRAQRATTVTPREITHVAERRRASLAHGDGDRRGRATRRRRAAAGRVRRGDGPGRRARPTRRSSRRPRCARASAASSPTWSRTTWPHERVLDARPAHRGRRASRCARGLQAGRAARGARRRGAARRRQGAGRRQPGRTPQAADAAPRVEPQARRSA